VPNNRNLKDALLKKSVAMPVSGVTAASDVIDTQNSPFGDFAAPIDVVITAPALTATQLPDGKSNTYTVEHSTSADFGTSATALTLGTQTGAGGAGDAGGIFRGRLPLTTKRYIRAKVTPSSTQSADQSAASMVLELLA
jgi:hypothetical protein